MIYRDKYGYWVCDECGDAERIRIVTKDKGKAEELKTLFEIRHRHPKRRTVN